LYGIDTPEKGQDFGQKARELTSALVSGRDVQVEQKDVDRYGRVVGLVKVDGQNLNELIIQNGYAWVYRQYCRSGSVPIGSSQRKPPGSKKKGCGPVRLSFRRGTGEQHRGKISKIHLNHLH